jgi:hypothetical protein
VRVSAVLVVLVASAAVAAPPVMVNLNPATKPSTRTGPGVASRRNAGELIYLFGGNALLSTNNQLWSYSVAANNWTQLTPGGTAPTARAWHNLTWDVGQQRLVLFGGSAALNGPLRNDVHLYDPVSGNWAQPTVVGTPPSPRFLANMVYVPSLGAHLVVFGGTATSANAEATTLTNELWKLTINAGSNTATWAQVTPGGTLPAARASACMGFDPARNRLVVFGGEIINDTINQTAQYDVASNTWFIDTPTGTPTKRGSAVCSFDERSGKLLIYGGVSAPSGTPLGAAYSYDPVAQVFTSLAPSPNPGTLTFAGPTYSPQLGAMFFFGGRINAISTSQATWTFRANVAPVLSVVSPVMLNEAAAGSFNASASTDADGDTLTYTWTQLTGPPLVLVNPTTATPSFTTPSVLANTPFSFSVVVSDGAETRDGGVIGTILDSVNELPVANAGPDQSVDAGVTVTLNGTASSDPNGEALSYSWTQSGGTAVTLNGSATATPTFTAPTGSLASTLTFLLSVTDTRLGSNTDAVSVFVAAAPPVDAGSGFDSGVGGGSGTDSGVGGGSGADSGVGGGSGADSGVGGGSGADSGVGGGSGADSGVGGGSGADSGVGGGSGTDGGTGGGAGGGSGTDGGTGGGAGGGSGADGGTDGGSSADGGALADAGMSDGGEDAGPPVARTLSVGCGCSSSADLSLLALALLLVARRRRKRPAP